MFVRFAPDGYGHQMSHTNWRRTIATALLLGNCAPWLPAEGVDLKKSGVGPSAATITERREQSLANVLSAAEWLRVDASVDRALKWPGESAAG
jgi:hypothetical protein